MTSTAPPLGGPPRRLTSVPPDQRAAILAAVTGPPAPTDVAMAWVEKLRRFASAYQRHLRRVARVRFGAAAGLHLAWMARVLLEGGMRHPERGAAPVDAACLGAALHCLDAVRLPDTASTALANRAAADLRAWAVTGGEQPPVGPALGCPLSYRPRRWRNEAASAVPVVIFAPTSRSLNAIAVLDLCRRLDVPVAGVVLRRFTLDRFRAEWRRDGPRLLRKIRRQLVLQRDEYPDPVDTSLSVLVERLDPGTRDLRRLARAMHVPLRRTGDFGDVADDPAFAGRKIGLFTGGGILPARLLRAFDGVVNVHTGHLPRYRGRDGVAAALLEGRPAAVGLTAHYMAPAVDVGGVLTRFSFDPSRYPTAGALANAVSGFMPVMLVDAALGAASGRLQPVAQAAAGRRYYSLHRRLRPIVDACLAGRHARADLDAPSPERRLLEAVCADLGL